MSTFENDQYQWRETYFVLFDSKRRPSLEKLQKALTTLNDRFALTNLSADEEGLFESLTLLAPDDFAALDLCYLEGEEVTEQAATLAEDVQSTGCGEDERTVMEKLKRCDGRFDVLHFEQVGQIGHGDEADDMLDPSALLIVLDALVELTDGIAVDPQSGSIV